MAKRWVITLHRILRWAMTSALVLTFGFALYAVVLMLSAVHFSAETKEGLLQSRFNITPDSVKALAGEGEASGSGWAWVAFHHIEKQSPVMQSAMQPCAAMPELPEAIQSYGRPFSVTQCATLFDPTHPERGGIWFFHNAENGVHFYAEHMPISVGTTSKKN